MSRKSVALFLLVGFSFASFAAAQDQKGFRAYPPKLAGAEVESYKTVGDTKLNLYIYYPPGHKATDKRAAIVFFFGGGWTYSRQRRAGGIPERPQGRRAEAAVAVSAGKSGRSADSRLPRQGRHDGAVCNRRVVHEGDDRCGEQMHARRLRWAGARLF